MGWYDPWAVVDQKVLTVDTGIYVNEVLSDIIELENFFPEVGASMYFDKFHLLDRDDDAVFDSRLFLLNANQSMGTKNATPSISDTNALTIQGYVDMVGADAVDIGGSKYYKARFDRIQVKAAADSRSLWVQLLTGAVATPTFTAATDLVINVGGYR